MALNDQIAFHQAVHRLDSADTKAAVILIVNDDGSIEPYSAGIDNPMAMWEICFSVCAGLSDEIMQQFTPEQKASARLVYPTAEQARELGLVPFEKRR